LQHRLAARDVQRLRHLGARAQALAVEKAARGPFDAAVVGRQAQEPELGTLLRMGGDEGALALAAHQQVGSGQFVDRLAHGALADLETGRQLDLAGDRLARFPLARVQPASDQVGDLAVQRRKQRRVRNSAHDGSIAAQSAVL